MAEGLSPVEMKVQYYPNVIIKGRKNRRKAVEQSGRA